MDANKFYCKNTLNDGVPRKGMFVIDGCSKTRGNTPKYSKQTSKGDIVLENRIIGVEVYCGPVETVLVYITSDMVEGGANIMIEVIRQALNDVALLLRRYGIYEFPKEWLLQFDNCSENKV